MKNKIMSLLLSLAVAVALWVYVITTVSPGSTVTISGIPVVYEGETVLTEDRGLMLTSEKNATVSLTLSGNRSDLAKLDKSNIAVKVDLTKIYDPGDRKLTYNYTWPADVPNNAITVESKYPGEIPVTVEKKLKTAIAVQVAYNGSVPEGFMDDRENAVLDYPEIRVEGPSSVVSLIDHARIEVDLTDRTESVSESYRYTLCDAEGNPVDVEQVTTDVAEIRLDLKIRRWEELELILNVNYGGGATEQTTNIDIVPKTIKVSGSEALLEGFGGKLVLGTINLAEITEDLQQTYDIVLPEGITNLSGVDTAAVDIRFVGLSTRDFTVKNIKAVNVPEGMDCEIISEAIKVTLRGPAGLINSLNEEDIVATADCAGREAGTSTVKAAISFADTAYDAIGVMGTVSVPVNLKAEK